MARHPRRSSGNIFSSQTVVLALGVFFGIALLITAILTFIVVRDTVRAWGDNDEPVLSELDLQAPATPLPTLPPDTVLQSAPGPQPVPWDGKSRMNVLFMGLDYRDWALGEGPPRTDTMMLVTIDPLTKTAGMLSIPRDLWVNVPGFNYAKINTAYYLGEAYQTPGGGPALAMETVENFLGVEIPYYAQVDFGTFVRLIDEIGGVTVDVPEEMQIDMLGDGSSTIKTLQPGRQTLPGEWALAYARNRDVGDGDFARAERQQQVIMGIRERLTRFDILPTLITRAPNLYRELSSGINTNLTFDQLVRLAWLGKDIPLDSIRRGIIGPDQTEIGTSPEGLWILVPRMEAIRTVRDEVFSSDGPIAPISTSSGEDINALAAAEEASISLRNGTFVPGLAASTSNYLAEAGLNISDVGNADQTYDATTVIDYTGNPYTLQVLAQLLEIDSAHILNNYDPDSLYDVVIILGADWANRSVP
jgi:LCP family protein required for cell wall assembly